MSILAPKVQKLIQEERDHLIRDQITPWIMMFASGRGSVEDFYKKRISYSGISFEGSPQNVFWGNYIEPFLEDITMRLITHVSEEAQNSCLNLTKELDFLCTALKGLYVKIYNEMARAEQLMLGRGYPDRISQKDISNSVNRMNSFLDQHISMEKNKDKERRASISSKEKTWKKRIWDDPVWSKVIAGALLATVGAGYFFLKGIFFKIALGH